LLKKGVNVTTALQNQIVVFISGAALLSSAFFLQDIYLTIALVSLMLFVPFLDRQWRVSDAHRQSSVNYWLVIIVILIILLTLKPVGIEIVLNQILIVSIPEEWFFRVYLINRLGMSNRANLISSCLFSILHMITRGWMIGFLVFVPSLIIGKIYTIKRDVVFIVLLHFTANIVYLLFIEQLFAGVIS